VWVCGWWCGCAGGMGSGVGVWVVAKVYVGVWVVVCVWGGEVSIRWDSSCPNTNHPTIKF